MKRASLNHLYRLVWSDADQAFVAVAEHSTSRGKRGGMVGFLAAVGLLGSGAVPVSYTHLTLPTTPYV